MSYLFKLKQLIKNPKLHYRRIKTRQPRFADTENTFTLLTPEKYTCGLMMGHTYVMFTKVFIMIRIDKMVVFPYSM